MRTLVLLTFAVVVIGCQSRTDAIRTMCEAPTACAACAAAPPAERAMLLAQYIDEHVSNGEVRDLFARLATLPPTERRAVVEREASAAGLSQCALLDAFGTE